MGNETTVRVRFAPSPTGYLHVGGARTALFNWLHARAQGGVFVLRIEDTDRERSSEAMTRAILDGMIWLGLDWDEGPYHQADGVQQHQADAAQLLEDDRAYRCFCTAAELDARRANHPGGPSAFRYDRRCASIPGADAARRAAAIEAHTIRFRVPPGTTRWIDAVHDEISFDNADIEDFIILRSDGTPIYNLAVVSDDVAMRITHVIRGDDHISNTPKQILLYEALGAAIPTFAHVPMILGPDGRRLSKRHGATAVGDYSQRGILPQAMVNFLALLGWSPGTDEEIFSSEELIGRFTLEGINRKSAIFDTQKLEWMNGRYLASMPTEVLAQTLRTASGAAFVDTADEPGENRSDDWWIQLTELLKVRARTIVEMAEQARPFIEDTVRYDDAAVAKHWKDPAATEELLGQLAGMFERLESFDEASMERELRALAEQAGLAAGKVIHPLRVALTGQAASPGIFEVARILGRDRVLQRLDVAIAELRRRAADSA
ncbi:glutamate--tRNA ligase [soil metagenome]